jgi:hypothetical protein
MPFQRHVIGKTHHAVTKIILHGRRHNPMNIFAFLHSQSVQLCSNMLIRDVVTSNRELSPEIEVTNAVRTSRQLALLPGLAFRFLLLQHLCVICNGQFICILALAERAGHQKLSRRSHILDRHYRVQSLCGDTFADAFAE